MVRGRLVAVLALLAGMALVQTGSAWAESCTFSGGNVTALMTPGSEATLRVSGGVIEFGTVPAPCGGATTATASSIEISGGVGTLERLTIDQSGGTFTPGAPAEGDLVSEIEIEVQLHDAFDTVFVRGTGGADTHRLGEGGLRLFADNDVDVTFPGAMPVFSFDLLGGADDFSALGGGGAGAAYAAGVTVAGGEGDDASIHGGNGDDVLNGGPGADKLYGDGGSDQLFGGDGDDRLDGGAGSDRLEGNAGLDSFYGRDGNDVINAFDRGPVGVRDPTVNGGLDQDTAYIDSHDVATGGPGIETVIRGEPDPSPPPTTGPCSYNAASRILTITMALGTPATLKVVGEQFVFGPGAGEACPTATRANTNEVVVFGRLDSSDTLTIEKAGFETEFLTIDLKPSTGTTDTLKFLGTSGIESIRLVAAGIKFVGGGSTPRVVFSVAPDLVELHGLGGQDILDAQGDSTSGEDPYLGFVRLYGGDDADTLLGSNGVSELYGDGGDDVLQGFQGNDLLIGGDGNDDLRGHEGDDSLDGGPGNDNLLGESGIDTFVGGDGDDALDARRPIDVAEDLDASIDGGPGADTAYLDPGEAALTVNVETMIGDSPPPPPPPGDCTYAPIGGQINVDLDAGAIVTFTVVGNAIWMDGAPCGTATTTTTSRIVVNGPSGSAERLVIDQRGGAFAPGHVNEATDPEPTDQTLRSPTISEIEFYVDLGDDPGDVIAVRGTNGNDSMAAGPKGIVVNGDGDTDVFVTLWLTDYVVELYGDGGQNSLSGMGAGGTGGYMQSTVRLFAGDNGDTLSGGYGHDELHGGAGADTIDGSEGNDVILGGGGADTLRGNGGADQITGGTGADTMIGGSGADVFRADDDEADANVSGGADVDTAHYDAGIDTSISGVEVKIAA